ncbi:MAG TPA: ATP synthase F0 subunit B [Oligoflexia bacterium]|nr:ATP synthase F0 subunit B [Oligoflexia bacterium]HMR24346.1 ATP synthase F0 subunit B [Oligoflexia bacterium]
MIKENRHIIALLALFLLFAKLLEKINLWGLMGLDAPHGLVFQGVLFFAFYFILKNFLFAPYIKIFQEREEATTGKRNKVEQMRLESDRLLEQYTQSIEEARLKAAIERDALLLEGEELEKGIIFKARQTAKESLEQEKEKIAQQAQKARVGLNKEIPRLSEEIVGKFIRTERKDGILKKAMRKAVS